NAAVGFDYADRMKPSSSAPREAVRANDYVEPADAIVPTNPGSEASQRTKAKPSYRLFKDLKFLAGHPRATKLKSMGSDFKLSPSPSDSAKDEGCYEGSLQYTDTSESPVDATIVSELSMKDRAYTQITYADATRAKPKMRKLPHQAVQDLQESVLHMVTKASAAKSTDRKTGHDGYVNNDRMLTNALDDELKYVNNSGNVAHAQMQQQQLLQLVVSQSDNL
ncbi:MAG: hypothetical protein VXY99_11125, partial [Pseudomonadota bacterium]|nr:hypothetical protein [Pseudomonadota bacterium]